MDHNNNLRDHEVYDSFYASDQQTAQVKSAIHVTPKSKRWFITYLIVLPFYIVSACFMIFGERESMPLGIFHFVFSVVFLGFLVFTYIVMLRERTFIFGFLVCIPFSVFGCGSLPYTPVLISAFGETGTFDAHTFVNICLMIPVVVCAMISFLLMVFSFSNAGTEGQSASGTSRGRSKPKQYRNKKKK